MDKPGGTSWTGDLWGGLAAMLVALPSAIAFGVTIFSPLGAGNVPQGALAGILGATVLGLIGWPAFRRAERAAVERGGPALKLFTVFYSFMNTAFNLGVGQTMTQRSKAKIAVDYLLLFTAPAILGTLLKDALQPGGDDDDEEDDE